MDPGWEKEGSIAREREGAVAWEGLGHLHDENEHRGVIRAGSERSDDVRVRQPAPARGAFTLGDARFESSGRHQGWETTPALLSWASIMNHEFIVEFS